VFFYISSDSTFRRQSGLYCVYYSRNKCGISSGNARRKCVQAVRQVKETMDLFKYFP